MRAILIVALIAACGGKSTPSTTTPTTPETAKAEEPAKPLPDLPFDKLDQDQRAQFMKEKVVPAMKQAGKGSFVIVGATASRRGGAKTAAFAQAKAAQRSLAESLARHLWPSGIHVSLIVIDGVVDLPRTRKMMANKPDSFFVAPDDVALLASTDTGVCACPTTERDLADGIGPLRSLAMVGVRLSLGSDQHAMIDLFEEARAVELDERLRTRERGHWTAGELLRAATETGHEALGWPDAGRIEEGAYADLVAVSLDSVRLAGAGDHLAESVVFAASPADVRDVIVSGREVVRDGRHLLVDDVPAALTETITAVTGRS